MVSLVAINSPYFLKLLLSVIMPIDQVLPTVTNRKEKAPRKNGKKIVNVPHLYNFI
jgi:hypothetical protein